MHLKYRFVVPLPMCFLVVAILSDHATSAVADPLIPDDPGFSQQWALENVGQVVEGESEPGMPGADIRATEAWAIHQGTTPVVVAIVGTGVNPHSEFADRLMEGHSTVGDPYNSLDTWPSGPYGTLVAGVIGAARNNGTGIAGLSSCVRILPVRVIETADGGSAHVAEGIIWAADQGAQVIVVPLQFPAGSPALENAISYAVGRDVLVIAPTGKDGNPSLAYPAAYENCLAVASTTHRDQIAPFSNYGAGTDLAAPGRNVLSTWRDDGVTTIEGAYAAAAGYVAGAAALVLSYAPQQSPLAVGDILMASADDLGDAGWDPYFGQGRLNVAQALQLTPPPALRFEPTAPLPVTVTPNAPTAVLVHITGVGEVIVPESVRLLQRQSGADFVAIDMLPAGEGDYSVDLPATACEETVEFYFEATGDEGTVVTDPIGAPERVYEAQAIQTRDLFYDDFEQDLGWEAVVEGSDTRGGWVRAEPIGTIAPTTGAAAQPAFDRSPDEKTTCYVTGQNPDGDAANNDVDGGPVRLLSPIVDVGTDDVEVSYAVWLHSSVGNEPDELTVELTCDNGASWQNVDTIAPTEGWEWRSFRLSAFPGVTGDTLRVRFSVSDLPSDFSLTEAGIDEFRVMEIRCQAATGDYDGNGVIDQADFAAFGACMVGPLIDGVSEPCRVFDFNSSNTIDLRDGQSLQRRYDPNPFARLRH